FGARRFRIPQSGAELQAATRHERVASNGAKWIAGICCNRSGPQANPSTEQVRNWSRSSRDVRGVCGSRHRTDGSIKLAEWKWNFEVPNCDACRWTACAIFESRQKKVMQRSTPRLGSLVVTVYPPISDYSIITKENACGACVFLLLSGLGRERQHF